MKKPMKKTKPRRFAEGGATDEDALKSKGLEESNKEAPVGFFKRLRMGNIDDSSSEAYKQFGAGRGRSVSVTPTPVNQIKDEDSFERVIKNAAVNDDGQVLETANKGEDLATSLRSENILKRTRDADNAPQVKKQAAPTAARGSGRGGQGGPTADELDRYAAAQKAQREAAYKKEVDAAITPEAKAERSRRAESEALENVYPEQFLGGVGIKTIARLAKAAAERIGGKRVLNTISQDAIGVSKPVAIGGSRAIEGANAIKGGGDGFVMYKKGGQVKKMASGGSVSSRGDGIAQRGKTRGKMC